MEGQENHKPHYRTLEDERLTADEMDEQRKRNIAYEYLCHLEEAKIWIEACINEELPPTTELEEGLRNGVQLARLGHFFAPTVVPLKKIYDKELSRYSTRGLHFRHTDNINHWLRAMEEIGLPSLSVDDAALHAAIIAINEAIDQQIAPDTYTALQNPSAMLVNLQLGTPEEYQEYLYNAKDVKAENARNKSLDPDSTYEHDVYDELLTQAEIQGNINKVNTNLAVKKLNEALLSGDKTALLEMLQSPALGLRDVKPANIDFYAQSLLRIRQSKPEDDALNKEDIQNAVNEANLEADVEYQKSQTVLLVNQALAGQDPDLLMKSLQNPVVQLTPVHSQVGQLYLEELASMRSEKGEDLEFEEIDAALQGILAITKINEAIDKGDENETVEALQLPAAQLNDIQPEQAFHYQVLLAKQKDKKAEESDDEAAELWLEEIQTCVDKGNSNYLEGIKISKSVSAVNEALAAGEHEPLLTALSASDLNLHSVTGDCIEGYQASLLHAVEESSSQGETGSGWMMNRLKDNTKFFYNMHTNQHAWTRGDNVIKDYSLLTRDEIQRIVSEVTAKYDREMLFKANENLITKIQAHVRGHNARKAYRDRVDFMTRQLPAILKIQLQSYVRMWRAKKAYQERLQYFRDN
ncbi:Ras GTPase-activating protein nGAP-like isoform X6, partial [Elysia marginata]